MENILSMMTVAILHQMALNDETKYIRAVERCHSSVIGSEDVQEKNQVRDNDINPEM